MAGYREALLWANDGQQVITGLTAGTKIYWENDPSNKKTNGFKSAPVGSLWHRVPLQGADTLAFEYASEILEVGGLGSGVVTAANMRMNIIGMGSDEVVPKIISLAPSAAPVGAANQDELAEFGLTIRPYDYRVARTIWPADTVVLLPTKGITGVVTPANGTKTFWGHQAGKRVYDEATPYVAGDFLAPAPSPLIGMDMKVTGLAVVYVSFATITAFDVGATLLTTRLKGTLKAILGYEGGSARFQRGIESR